MGGHSPKFDTIIMVEKTLVESTDYPTRMQLFNSLPKKMHYSTFKKVIDYLQAHVKIEFNGATIVYVEPDEKLKKYLSSFTELK